MPCRMRAVGTAVVVNAFDVFRVASQSKMKSLLLAVVNLGYPDREAVLVVAVRQTIILARGNRIDSRALGEVICGVKVVIAEVFVDVPVETIRS